MDGNAEWQFSDPWSLFSKFHGIPYIQNNDYSFYGLKINKNISFDLYQRLEKLQIINLTQIQNYYMTQIYLPSMMTLLLQNCGQLEDIPIQILYLREKFSKFRNSCTEIDYEMRTAKNRRKQYELLAKMNSNFNAILDDCQYYKSRIFYSLSHIAVNPFEKTIERLTEIGEKEQRLHSVSGYYNLWQAMLDLQPGINVLKKFKLDIDSRIIEELQQKIEFAYSK